ncbi:MAG: GNAT family N-acetyltransferase [Candidatus Kapabacteria bacterium]|nr:GNAT family N-acetyltransferase [Candidatus Kapabacteria bacterium]
MNDPLVDVGVEVFHANESHTLYAEEICETIFVAAQQRGTGIARRTPEYIIGKMMEGKAIIALTQDGRLAGFCYVETWEHGRYVANSGLIVKPEFRKQNLARRIKKAAFDLSRERYPSAKLFGITTSAAVMKINSELGYRPVHFSELTSDEAFWSGCQSCPNYDILQRTNRAMCLCTGMLADSASQTNSSSEDA